MDRLSHILPKVFEQHGIHNQAVAHLRISLVKHWLQREFPQYEGLFRPTKVEKGVLYVETTDSEALASLQATSQELLAYLKKESQGPDIQSVRVLKA